MTLDYAIERMIADIPILYRQIFGVLLGMAGLFYAWKSEVFK